MLRYLYFEYFMAIDLRNQENPTRFLVDAAGQVINLPILESNNTLFQENFGSLANLAIQSPQIKELSTDVFFQPNKQRQDQDIDLGKNSFLIKANPSNFSLLTLVPEDNLDLPVMEIVNGTPVISGTQVVGIAKMENELINLKYVVSKTTTDKSGAVLQRTAVYDNNGALTTEKRMMEFAKNFDWGNERLNNTGAVTVILDGSSRNSRISIWTSNPNKNGITTPLIEYEVIGQDGETATIAVKVFSPREDPYGPESSSMTKGLGLKRNTIELASHILEAMAPALLGKKVKNITTEYIQNLLGKEGKAFSNSESKQKTQENQWDEGWNPLPEADHLKFRQIVTVFRKIARENNLYSFYLLFQGDDKKQYKFVATISPYDKKRLGNFDIYSQDEEQEDFFMIASEKSSTRILNYNPASITTILTRLWQTLEKGTTAFTEVSHNAPYDKLIPEKYRDNLAEWEHLWHKYRGSRLYRTGEAPAEWAITNEERDLIENYNKSSRELSYTTTEKVEIPPIKFPPV